MVAIVSGIRQGLELGSRAVLGQAGMTGNLAEGRNGQGVYVNVGTGLLVVQNQDDLLVARGQDQAVLRTYNSGGIVDADNGDFWRADQLSLRLTGTLNAAGSTLVRVDRDGSAAVYAYDGSRNAYVTAEGAGANDTITHIAADGQFEWRDGSTGATQRFEGSGDYRLLSSQDTSGNALTYAYGASGLLSSVTSASGESTFYDYTGTSLTQVRTVAGGVTTTRVRYGYDGLNRLDRVTVDLTPLDNSVADGKVYETKYTYDGTSKRLAGITQSDGTSLAISYVDTGGGNFKVASIRDGLGQATTFAYGEGFATVTNALNLTTRYEFDGLKQLTKIIPPAVAGASATRQFAYAPNGDVVSVTDGEGRVTSFGYDGSGNQVLQRDHAGNTVRRTFDARNQLLTETIYLQPDPDGAGAAQPGGPQTTRYVYDAAGRSLLRFQVSAEGRVTEHRYDGFGERVASITYAGGVYPVAALAPEAALGEATLVAWAGAQDLSATQRVDFAYDARGQLQTKTSYGAVSASGAGIVDASRSVEQYVYDQAGLLLQAISATNGTTSYAYDGLGRLLARTDALGRTTVTAYDDAGRKVTVTSANGLLTTSAFDAAGRLVAMSESDSAGAVLGQTQYFYDAGNRLRVTQDPTGVRSWIFYDEAGRKTADVDGTGTLTEYSYNRAGQVTRKLTRGNAVDMAALADAAGLPLLSATLDSIRPADSAGDHGVWHEYDAAGRLLRVAEHTGVDVRASVREMRYDGASRLVQVLHYANTVPADGAAGSVAPGFIPVPAASAQDRVSRSFFDADGRVAGSLDAEGYLTVFRYTPAGQLAERIAYANATDAALRGSGTLAQLVPAASAADIREVTLYNAKGQAMAHVDGEGFLTESVYDSNGNLTQSIRYATPVSVAVDASSTIAAIRPTASAADRVHARVYDLLDRLTQETSPEGVVTQYTYDAAGNLASTTRAAGTAEVRTLLARHDLQGRLTGELSAQGAALLTGGQAQAEIDAIWVQYGTTHTYDAASRRTSTTDAAGNRTLFFYDADGALTHRANALGEVQETRYDARGRAVQQIAYANRIDVTGLDGGLATASLRSTLAAVANAALDSQTIITYTRDGKVATTTDAVGTVTTATYNAFGDELGRQTVGTGVDLLESFSVDRRGLRTGTVSDPAGIAASITTVYDAFGRATRTTDANGRVREQDYDRLGRMVTTRDPLDDVRSTAYDAFSRVLSQTDALGNVTRYAYDAASRSTKVTSPEGVETTTSYNRHGEVQTVSDGNGHLTSYRYDRNGALLEVITPLGSSGRTYDSSGLLTETRDANGNRIVYTYDAAQRVLTRRVDPDGLNLTTTYAYDAKGQRIAVTDANGVVTTTGYDRNGRAMTQTVDPAGLNLQTTYAYDARGNTLTVTSPGGTVTQYTYDALGRRIAERVDPAGLDLQRSWSYDGNGNVVASTDARGNVTRYAYDAAGRLVFTINPQGDVRQNGYDGEGRLVRTVVHAKPISLTGLAATVTVDEIQARVASEPSLDRTEHRVLDQDGRVLATIDGTGAVVRYAYDGNGNVVSRIGYANRIDLAAWTPESLILPAADDARDSRTSTLYDALNRAVYTVDGVGAVVAQAYDGAGNVVQRTAYAAAVPAGTLLTETALSAAVALVADPARDANQRFVYDAAGRLAWTVDGVGAVTQHSHDGNGNLVRQVAYAAALPPGGSVDALLPGAADRVTSMAYDAANRRVLEIDALRAVTESVYDAEGSLLRRTAYAHAIGSVPPLGSTGTAEAIRSMLEPDASLDRSTRYAYDAAGRQVLAVDAEGAITDTEYDAAGNVVRRTAYATSVDPSLLPEVPALADLQALVTPLPAADRSTRYAFDAAGQLTFQVDALDGVTRFGYDGVGRVIETRRYAQPLPPNTAMSLQDIAAALVTDPMGRVESHTYDAAGNRLSTRDAAGWTESWSYDGLAHKTSFRNKKGAEWTYTYDAAGRMTSETSPEVTLTASVFDQAAIAVREGASGVTRVVTLMGYDALGNLTQRTEAAGRAGEERVTRYEYDAVGHQVRVIHPSASVYDANADQPTANNGIAPRTESIAALETRTFYNAFGEAVANRDVGVGLSQKVYDLAGRVVYDIDALGFVTGYTRDAFGDTVALTRYASRTGLSGRSVADAAHAATRAEVEAALGATGDHSKDRTLQTRHDRLGRVAETWQPEVFVFDATLQGSSFIGQARTRNTYNAFGERVEESKARDQGGGSWYVTTRHFDRLGRESAVIDAMGYLSTRAYDSFGHLVEAKEYATALDAGAWDANSYGATPAASPDDRTTRYAYDLLDRKISEVRVGVEYSTASDGTRVRGDLTTSYQYDAVGNQTATTDALGQTTWTSYDALGRIRAIATPFAGGTSTLTEFKRDAHGNAVSRLEHATPVAVAGTDMPTLAVADADRLTLTRFDALGRAMEVQDANGNVVFSSYDARGNLAKTWQGLTDSAGVTRTRFQVNVYDALGQLVETRTPASTMVVKGGGVNATFIPPTDLNQARLFPEQHPYKLQLGWSDLIEASGGTVRVQVDYMASAVMTFDDSGAGTWHPAHLETASLDLSAAAAEGGAEVTWTTRTDSVVYIRIQQLVGGRWTSKWEGSMANANGSDVVALSQAEVGLVRASREFNAFGEMTRRGTQGGWQEYFEYDAAGRLWRTNSGDGVDRIQLYDLQGNLTSEIRSDGAGGLDQDLVQQFASAQEAEATTDTRRIDIRYDGLGHVTSRTEAQRLQNQGGVSIQRQFVTASAQSATVITYDDVPGIYWTGLNQVTLGWKNLVGLGSGDLMVLVEYKTPIRQLGGGTDPETGAPIPITYVGGVARSYKSTMLVGDQNRTGTTLRWEETAATQDEGGVGQVTHVRLLKKDVNGAWVVVLDQDPGYGANEILVGAPADPEAVVTLEVRKEGTTTWSTAPGALVDFGLQLRYDTAALGIGSFEYRVNVKQPGQDASVQIASGKFTLTQPALAAITTPIVFGQANYTFYQPVPGALSWAHQDFAVTQVLRYRLAGSTQAWSTLPIKLFNSGTRDGVDCTNLAGGTYQFELLWSQPGQGVPTHHATGTFKVVPPQPSYWVAPVGLPNITGLYIRSVTDQSEAGTTTTTMLYWDACNATSAKYYKNGQWISLWIDNSLVPVTDANDRSLQRVNLSALGPGSYPIEIRAYSSLKGQMLATATYTVSSTGTRTLKVTTPPYKPGYWTAEVPAQYYVSVTTAAASVAISTTDGAAIAQTAGSSTGNRSLRPEVKQNTDRWGNVVSISDPRSANWVTTYRFDAGNRMIRQMLPVASTLGAPSTEIYYDALGRQVAVRDANGYVNGQAFDAAGNLVEERHADGGVVRHTYDALGRKTQTVDAMGHAVTFRYDRMGNLLEVNKGLLPSSYNSGGLPVWMGKLEVRDRWTYDQLGQKLSYTNGHGEKLSFTYDLRGNVVETRQPMGQATRSAFDANGRKIGEVDANNIAAYWTYDYFGRLTAHTDLGGARYTYTYDHARQLVRQTNTRYQDLRYSYDSAGQLVQIYDAPLGQTTAYMYDEGGRRVRERMVQGGVTYQDNHLGYDAVGNLRDVADAKVHISMNYDLVGNRTFVGSYVTYTGKDGTLQTSQVGRHFQYNAMNWQKIVDAVDAAGNLGETGHRITYDFNGNRISDTAMRVTTRSTTGESPILYFNDSSDGTAVQSKTLTYVHGRMLSTEVYRYDAANRLQSIVRDGVQVDHRRYDRADRLLFSGPATLPPGYRQAARTGLAEDDSDGLERRIYRYDANGRLQHQKVQNGDGSARSDVSWDPNAQFGGPTMIADGYDAVGNAKGYIAMDAKSGAVSEFSTTFRRFEGHQASVTTGRSTALDPGSSTQGYDKNGFLVSVTDSTYTANNRVFVNDAEGRALYVNQGGRIQRQLIVNGEVLGLYGIGVDPQKPRDSNNNPNFANIVDFDFGYAPISSTYPAPAPGAYIIKSGDTLQSIAQGAYGDSALWYRIAEANGLVTSTDLKVGQTLNIPNRVSTIHNNDSTFKPYDPSRITGDLTPNLPMPDKGGCGGVGQLLTVVVTVAVTIFTAGAGAVLASGGTLATASAAQLAVAGLGAMSGTFGIGVAAAAAAIGSVTGQLVGVAIGSIEKFSWKSAALSAIGGGVAAEIAAPLASGSPMAAASAMPAASGFAGAGDLAAFVGKALVGSGLSQGVGVALGLQKRFDWRSVMGAGIGAAVGYGVSEALGAQVGADSSVVRPAMFHELGDAGHVLRGAATGMAAGAAAALARGGRIAIQQVAIDAFGNALGRSIAGASNSTATTPAQADSDDLLGRFIAENNNWAHVNVPAVAQQQRDLLYGWNTGNDGLGLRPTAGVGTVGMRHQGVRSSMFDDTRVFSDSDDPSAVVNVGQDGRPTAFMPIAPAAVGGVVGGGAATAGGYEVVRPRGAGGPPGYDLVRDMPSGAPGSLPANPNLGLGAPPQQAMDKPWFDRAIEGMPIGVKATVDLTQVITTKIGEALSTRSPSDSKGAGVRAYPDGSLRTPDGKFASAAGMPAPGTVNASNYAEFLKKNGVDVVGTELEVAGPLGVRKYDIGTRNPDGTVFGIEIKSGGATKTWYQEITDMYVNQFGVAGRGRIEGQRVTGSMTIYLPPGGH